MPISVMRLTNINKGIIKLLPQIVTLIILITTIPQLAKLTWRVVFPVSPEDISALPLTASPGAEAELKSVRPVFTLFGLAAKKYPGASGGYRPQSGAGFQSEVTPYRPARQQQSGTFYRHY